MKKLIVTLVALSPLPPSPTRPSTTPPRPPRPRPPRTPAPLLRLRTRWRPRRKPRPTRARRRPRRPRRRKRRWKRRRPSNSSLFSSLSRVKTPGRLLPVGGFFVPGWSRFSPMLSDKITARPIKKILAIKIRALGDTVLMTAPVQELLQGFPRMSFMLQRQASGRPFSIGSRASPGSGPMSDTMTVPPGRRPHSGWG